MHLSLKKGGEQNLDDNEKDSHHCHKCMKRFSKKGNLRAHKLFDCAFQQDVPRNTESCEECEQTYETKSDLKVHKLFDCNGN